MWYENRSCSMLHVHMQYAICGSCLARVPSPHLLFGDRVHRDSADSSLKIVPHCEMCQSRRGCAAGKRRIERVTCGMKLNCCGFKLLNCTAAVQRSHLS